MEVCVCYYYIGCHRHAKALKWYCHFGADRLLYLPSPEEFIRQQTDMGTCEDMG